MTREMLNPDSNNGSYSNIMFRIKKTKTGFMLLTCEFVRDYIQNKIDIKRSSHCDQVKEARKNAIINISKFIFR